jgi:serine/threonine protein kinase/Flp pilus assembly protein TadD
MGQALEDYLAAVTAGTAPPREEFLALHPELAEDLNACLAALRFIGRAARGPLSAVGDGEVQLLAGRDGEPVAGVLGDFRIIREVGRGGMGVVYEAEQVSLGRRVALKVLPFAATMDPRQLQRFHNEARAAASLDHPHIVHVHAVGCERAVHFYAMQFIEGQTLAAMIADLRRAGGQPVAPEAQATTPHVPGQAEPAAPSADTAPRAAASTERTRLDRAHFRRVAELGIQAAEALDHAHRVGIVHRDVKPANLLVDERGGLWVTDFGLAHIQSDARLTMTGDLVGTLRYMSPEQASAQRVVIDHRTDVYSLGATLYELLTLEPAFRGNDRQELLRQIAFEEPVRPRRVNRAIPAELETIVLKAMEKNPAERYATAKELADDLRRWLADEPIRARPAGVVRRVRKWGQRHRPAVVATAVVLALALVLLGGAAGWLIQWHAAAEDKVQEALEAAVPGLREGNPWDPDLISAARQAEAQLDSGLLGSQSRRRVKQLQKDVKMLTALERIRLEQAGLRDYHFDKSVADPQYIRAFQEYGIDVATLEPEAAAALVQASAIREHLVAGLDDWADCVERLSTGKENPRMGQLLTVAQQVDPDPWRNRLRVMVRSGRKRDLEELVRSVPVEDLPASTLVLLGHWAREGFLGKSSGPTLELLRRAQRRFPADFWINHDLAFVLAMAQPPELEEAIGFYRAAVALRPRSPGVRVNLGMALITKGDLDGASAEYRKAIELVPTYAPAYANLGATLSKQGDLDGAVAAYRKAIELAPTMAPFHDNLARDLISKGDLDGAIAECHKAIHLDPNRAAAHVRLGSALGFKGDLDGAIAQCGKAIDLDPKDASAHALLGAVLGAKQNLDGAISELHKAIDLDPKDARAHHNLGNTLIHKGDVDRAIAAYKKAIELEPKDARAHYDLGIALHAKGDLDGAIAEYREAIRLKNDYAEAHCNLGTVLCDKGRFAEALSYFRAGHELGSKNPRWPYPSARWLRECERFLELEPRLPAIVSGREAPTDPAERLDYALLCERKQFHAAATRLFREAFTAQPSLASVGNDVLSDAASAALGAGRGAGEDAAQLTDAERAGYRKQALDWLRADLEARRGLLDKEPGKVAEKMRGWLGYFGFHGVRGPDALAKLPEAERQDWQKLWADVAATLAKAQEKGTPAGNRTPPQQGPKNP